MYLWPLYPKFEKIVQSKSKDGVFGERPGIIFLKENLFVTNLVIQITLIKNWVRYKYSQFESPLRSGLWLQNLPRKLLVVDSIAKNHQFIK